MNIPQWTLGDRLRKAREHAGLKQEEMADIIGVSASTVSNWETGRHHGRAELDIIRRWAGETCVSLEWLLGLAPDQSVQDVPVQMELSRAS